MGIVPPSREELSQELGRLLSSKTFSASRRSRQLLEYLFNQLLEGTASQLKEYTIGVDVFNRPVSYDPQLDTIVRTETWRLRNKLAAYYDGEGKDNPLQIGFRPRSMVPIAQYRAHRQPAVPRPSTVRGLQRIAVLPFTSIGGDDGSFGEGLATDVLALLGELRTLQIVPRTSSFAFKDRDRGDLNIAAELNADLLVEGTVQMRGDEVRVTSFLTDALSATQIFAATYDRKKPFSLHVQQELARKLTSGISGALLERASVAIGGAEHSCYLDALMRTYFQFKYRQNGIAELAEKIRFFEVAAASHPSSRLIRRALSTSLGSFMALSGAAIPEFMPRLLASGAPPELEEERIIEAQVCAGVVAMFQGRFAKAAEMLARTVALHQNNAMAQLALGIVLMHASRLDDALQVMSTSQRLDPLSSLNAGLLATVLFSLRRNDAAREQVKLCLALDPQNMMARALLADIELAEGKHDEALEKSFAFYRMSNGHPLAIAKVGYIYGLRGQQAEVHKILNTLLAKGAEPGGAAPAIALVYLGMGDSGRALNWMRTAAEQNILVDIIPTMPFFDPLRSDPNFTALIPSLR